MSTAVLFLNVELLAEFYYRFPRELDARLGRGGRLSADDLERIAREDPRVARHLDVVRRKDLLELVLRKMEALRGLERERESGLAVGGSARREKETGKGRRNWFS